MLAVVQQAQPVVHTVVQQVAVTPEWVNQVVNFGSLVVPGYIASFLHSVLTSKSGKLQQDEYDWLNAGLLFVYSAVISAVVLQFEGKLSLHSPETLGAAFLTVLGAASLRYNALKLTQGSQSEQAQVPAVQAQVASPAEY